MNEKEKFILWFKENYNILLELFNESNRKDLIKFARELFDNE